MNKKKIIQYLLIFITVVIFVTTVRICYKEKLMILATPPKSLHN